MPAEEAYAKALPPEQARQEFVPWMGRTTFYRLLRSGDIPSIRLGRRFLIPRVALETWLRTCGANVVEIKARAAGANGEQVIQVDTE